MYNKKSHCNQGSFLEVPVFLLVSMHTIPHWQYTDYNTEKHFIQHSDFVCRQLHGLMKYKRHTVFLLPLHWQYVKIINYYNTLNIEILRSSSFRIRVNFKCKVFTSESFSRILFLKTSEHQNIQTRTSESDKVV